MNQLQEESTASKENKCKLFDKYKTVTMNMKDLAQSVFDTTKERIKNPFVGSYIISFVVIHWKPILYLLFSASSIEMKLCVIQEEYVSNVYLSFLIPLGIAFFYVVLLPYVEVFFEFLTTKARKHKLDRQYNLTKDVLTKDEDIAKAENKNSLIRTTTNDIKELTTKHEQLQEKHQAIMSELELSKQECERLKKIEEKYSLLVDQSDNEIKIGNYLKANGLITDYHKTFFKNNISFNAESIGIDLYVLMNKAGFIVEVDNFGQLSDNGNKYIFGDNRFAAPPF